MKPIDGEKLLEWISVRLQQHREDKLIARGKLTEHAYFIGRQAEINHLKTALKSGHFDIDPPVPDIHPGQKQECDYCGEESDKVRPTSFMADVPAKMCRHCWEMTRGEYRVTEETDIGEFDDYKHFEGAGDND